MKFEKPPLIELIAEFRWLPVNVLGEEITQPTAFLQAGPPAEAFYEAFRLGLAAHGYKLSERLIPQNFPHPIYQPVFRYSSDDKTSSHVVYQTGPGILSVHALPPYENWEAFKPVISTGLNALIAGRTEAQKNKVFTGVSLRYIDAFNSELRGGRSERKFLSEVLGFSVGLPPVFAEQAADVNETAIAMQLKCRIKSGLDLLLSVGPNVDQGDPNRIVMDTMVSSPKHVDWDSEAVVEVLERAHTSIRALFVGMTSPIHDLMKLKVDRSMT
jgi:uncharacterized protein (TIGR04255 family)